MNKETEQLFQRLRSERLTESERFAMRSRLQSLQKALPVSQPWSIRQLLHSTNASLSLSIKPMFIALIVAISMVVSGGVSLAAEQSLPGEALYAIKTHVNEPIRGALAVSEQAQADWDARRVERRLEEAEALSVGGRLTADLRAAIEEQVKERVEAVKESVTTLRGHDDVSSAAEVSARLEVALGVHEQVLAKLAEKHDGETTSLHEKVKKEHEDSQKLEDEVKKEEEADDQEENQNDKQQAAEGKLNAAEHKIAEVRDFISKAKVSAEMKAQAETKLAAVDALIVTGKASLTAGKFDEAFNTFRQAMRDAQDVKIFVATHQTLSNSVREDVDKEDDHEKNDDRDEDDDHESARKPSTVQGAIDLEVENDRS